MTTTLATDTAPLTGDALRSRYDEINKRIGEAAARSGRKASQVVLVAVSKTASMEQIRELVQAGHVHFGENRVQQLQQRVAQVEEFQARRRELTGAEPAPVRWHMIGSLQRNKVKKAIECARLIHSVDSMRLAEDIQNAAARREDPVDILIEVNVSGEASKHGLHPPAVRHVIEQIDTMVNVRPRGLMCMAPNTQDMAVVRDVFERCRELFQDIRSAGVGGDAFDLLSMGMSNDFEAAIECGSNMVRIGSALFGAPAVQDDPGEG